MRIKIGLCFVVGVISLVACAGTGKSEPVSAESTVATKAQNIELAGSGFKDVRISMLKSLPPQFVLHLIREMPTPGWTFDIDDVDVDPKARRIVVHATEKRPDGIVVQVIGSAEMRVELGVLDAGRYVLECRIRRGTERGYVLTDAMVVVAR